MAVPVGDYDSDGDGLIEVANLTRLRAIRWDLDGNGEADSSANEGSYSGAFPGAGLNMGCPLSGCAGYEFTSDLDFEINGDGSASSGDDYWNDGKG